MRIGISIEKNRVSSVVVNTSGMIIHSEKTQMVGGLSETLKKNIEQLVKLRRDEISHVFIGTDFVRTLVQYHTNHTPVGVIRLAGHQPDILMPCFNWPEGLKESVFMDVETIDGGYDYDGKPITPLSDQQVLEAAQRLVDKGAQSIVICGVFSTFYPDQEIRAAQIVRDNFNVDILACHELGIIGFMERENAGILNATFRKAFYDKLHDIQRTFRDLKMSCALFFTQTNGALLSLEEACAFPFQTIDSALINAFVGGTKLTQYQDCCAIYMDETGSHAMVLQEGAITEHALNNEITSHDFTVPGLHYKNIGMSSVVTIDEYRITIGEPCDAITAKTTFTLEAAMRICNGLGHFNDKVDVMTAYRVIKTAENILIDFYKSMNNKGLTGPLVLIGPAAALFPHHETVVVSPFSVFASAYGAAMQGITCYISKTVRLTNREKQLTDLCDGLVQRIYHVRGHEPKIVYFDVQPFRYLPEEWAQVTIVATGNVDAPRINQPETIQELIASNMFGDLKKPILYTKVVG
jgi:N-methylhydantoinase A/oxoprolinase/acetone carboxylase beta subunit